MMSSKRIGRRLSTALAILFFACACERTTSVGAAGGAGDASTDDAAAPALEKLCTTSGGTVTTSLCCASAAPAFPDTCAIGACGCAPASSRSIATCDCPSGCFSPEAGCVNR